MTDQPTADPIGETTPETARALLWRHGLPEDVIDGALCLHAQELAAVQRREAAVWGVDTAAGKRVLATADLIDPTTGATQPAVPVSSPPPDQTADRDRIAEALLDHLSRTADIRPGRTGDLAFMPEVTDAERLRITDAVLAVLPPPAARAAVYREVADRLTTDAHGMQPDWARIYKRDAAVKVREWADRLDGEARQDDTTPRPVQHAPGKAVLCPDCLTKGHAVCMPDPQPPAHTGRTADDCP